MLGYKPNRNALTRKPTHTMPAGSIISSCRKKREHFPHAWGRVREREREMSFPAEEGASSEKGADGAKQRGIKKMCKPKKWCEEIGGIKQPCWCGEEWHDNHEDADHGPVFVQLTP